MAERIPLFLNLSGTEAFTDEMQTTDTVTFGQLTIDASGTGIVMNSKKITGLAAGTASGDGLAYGQTGAALQGLSITTNPLTMGGQKITGLADGAAASQDAATVSQVESLVATGNIFKEPVFSAPQLKDGASGGIAAEQPWAAVNQPTAGDTIVVTDGSTTVTFTFVANQGAESTQNDVSIESSGATAMQRWILRANAHTTFNTVWTAYECTAHPELQGDGGVMVHVNEDVAAIPSESPKSTSRLYGTWTTQADFNIIEFADNSVTIPYNQGTVITAPTSDPGNGRFGFQRAESELVDGEVHLTLDANAQYSWDDGSQVWNQISGTGSIPDATAGSGGGTKGLVTADSDKGLDIPANGVLQVDLATNKGLEFDSGDIGIKLDTTPGLSLGAGGISWTPDTTRGLDVDGSGAYVDLATDPGLQFTGGNLEAKVDGTTGAMQKGSAGLQVKVESSKGLSISAAGLAGVPNTSAGLSVGASGFAIDLATNPGLQFTGGDLEAKVNGTTGAMAKDANGLRVKADAAAGIEITASGVAIDLAASQPGLSFDGSGDLEALVDSTRGIDKDASGIFTKLLAAGGIQFDGSGNLRLKLDDTPDTLDVDVDGLKVVGLPSLFKIDDTAVGATVTAANLDELTDGSSTTLHTHPGIAESGRVENDLEVDEAISAGDPVYWNATADRIAKADASVDAKGEVFGLARTAQSTVGQNSSVVSMGIAAGVLTGATPGDNYFLQAGGGIASTTPSGGPRRIVQMGWAVNATDLWVHIIEKGRRRV